MIIKKVTLQNIKSFRDETIIDLSPDLNIVVGSNSGGKSNFLEIVQGIINDVFFDNVTFQDNTDENTKSKHFREDRLSRNENLIKQNIFDKYLGNENNEQYVTLEFEIQRLDVNNLRTLVEHKEEIIAFENEECTSPIISQVLQNIDFGLTYEQLIGSIIEVKVQNGTLFPFSSDSEDENGNTMKHFYYFLQNLRLIYSFIQFYNFSRGENIKFNECFYYVSPNREPVNLTDVEQTIDLSNTQSISVNQAGQASYSQNTRIDSWQILLRVLAENHFSNKKENEIFQKLLKKYLNLTFTIKRRGASYQNKFGIQFKRLTSPSSPKLSSGEKEIFSMLAIIFTRKIGSGIILIDEPEIHLHPRWQKKLLSLLDEVVLESKVQIILVTHSPHFIRSENISNLIRIYKNQGVSQVILPNNAQIMNKSKKDTFLFITSSNNEKVFFADKVVLVEGPVDRIIFETIFSSIKDENEEIIEVIEVYGKSNFTRFSAFLDIWKIKHSVIADLDYLKEIGSAEVKSFFALDKKKIKESLKDGNSTDISKLVETLISFTKKENATQVKDIELQQLKELVDYIAMRNSSLKSDLDDSEKAQLTNYIADEINKGVYLLKEGTIENYFKYKSKLDIEDAIEISSLIKKSKTEIPEELEKIAKRIIA